MILLNNLKEKRINLILLKKKKFNKKLLLLNKNKYKNNLKEKMIELEENLL